MGFNDSHSSLVANNPFNYHLSPLDEVWLSEPETQINCFELEEYHCIVEDHESVQWIDKTPDDPSDSISNLIEKFNSENKTSACATPVVVLEGGNAAVPMGGSAASQPYADDDSIVALPNIPYVESNDAPVASDDASVADSYFFDEPDSKHLHQCKQIWKRQSGHLCRTNKVT